jgi:hypothetical protein
VVLDLPGCRGQCRFNPLQMDEQIVLEDIDGLVAECVEPMDGVGEHTAIVDLGSCAFEFNLRGSSSDYN